VSYLSASEVMIHEEALYQVFVPVPLRYLLSWSLRTDCKAIGAVGLQRQRDERDDGEDAARHDQIDDVVERFAKKMNREDDATIGRLTTIVPHLRHSHWNAYAQHFPTIEYPYFANRQ